MLSRRGHGAGRPQVLPAPGLVLVIVLGSQKFPADFGKIGKGGGGLIYAEGWISSKEEGEGIRECRG